MMVGPSYADFFEVPLTIAALVNVHSSLGLIHHRLGFSGKAGINLLKGQALIKEFGASISAQTQLRWNLSYTEYLVAIGNTDKGLTVLKSAGQLMESDKEFVESRKMNDRRSNKIRINTVVANAAYITSLIALQKVCGPYLLGFLC
jgi:separase